MFQCFSLDLDIFNKDRGGPKGKLGVLSPSLSTLVFFLFFFRSCSVTPLVESKSI